MFSQKDIKHFRHHVKSLFKLHLCLFSCSCAKRVVTETLVCATHQFGRAEDTKSHGVRGD